MRKVIFGVTVVILGACVSLNTTTLNPSAEYAPVQKDQVRIFQGGDNVPEPWVKIAIFNASGSDSFTDESDLYGKMREEAAKRGCNGVVLQGHEDAGTAERIFFGMGADQEAEGVCIRYGDSVDPEDADSNVQPDSVPTDSVATDSSKTPGDAITTEGDLPVIQL